MDTPRILNGKETQRALAPLLLKRVSSYGKTPGLAIISLGKDDRSKAYIKQKVLFGQKIGVRVSHHELSIETSEEDLIAHIDACNKDLEIHGIILQLPLPKHISSRAIDRVDPSKDVDGLNSYNLGNLVKGERCFMPATARGVMELLKIENTPLQGKHAVIVGRSTLVGKPLALAFLAQDATVTLAHSKTVHLKELTKQADILCVAIGKPGFITKEHVKPGQIVIDIGITVQNGGTQLVGDVLFEEVKDIVSRITPVPGGVGPMTVYGLFANVCDAFERSNSIQ